MADILRLHPKYSLSLTKGLTKGADQGRRWFAPTDPAGVGAHQCVRPLLWRSGQTRRSALTGWAGVGAHQCVRP